MKQKAVSVLTVLILTIANISAQNYDPIDLAKQIFNKNGFKDIDKYITGEYEGSPNGEDLSKETTTKFLLLGQDDNSAVVSMTILNSKNEGFDTYLHFKKDSIWKMEAFRALAMTGIIEQMLIELEKMTPQEIDNEIAESQKDEESKKYSAFSSKEEFNFTLGNAKLTIALDENIINHFIENKDEFEEMKDIALKELENKTDKKNVNLIENKKSDYQKLFISSISFGNYDIGNCLNFSIGGILDNTVGYIYVKEKEDLPKMNPDSIIMIREIGNGWYLYKTT